MRTLIAAAEPPPRRPVDGYTFTKASGSAAHTVIMWLAGNGHTVTPWQEAVIGAVYAEPEPYRTVAFVDRRRAIEAAGGVVEGEIA